MNEDSRSPDVGPALQQMPPRQADYDVVSIIGLALTVAFCLAPVGLVMGIIGLKRTKGGRYRGRAIAVASTIVGGIGTLLVALFVALGLAGAFDEEDPFAAMTVGTCFNDSGAEEVLHDEIPDSSTITIVDCTESHQLETYRVIEMSGRSYPGASAIDDRAYRGCTRHFESYVGVAYEESALEFLYYHPSKTEWADGDHRIFCAVVDATGAHVTGSLRGSKR